MNPALTAEQTKQILRETAGDLGRPGWDPEFGHGLVNVHSAVVRALPPYGAAHVGQTQPGPLERGTSGRASIDLRNTGAQTWYRDGPNAVRLGTDRPGDRATGFGGGSGWLGLNRIQLEQAAVAPGQVGRFSFDVTANPPPGTYREYFRPVADGVGWMHDLGLFLQPTVIPRDQRYLAEFIWQVHPGTLEQGTRGVAWFDLRNVGTETWFRDSRTAVRLATARPTDRGSGFSGGAGWGSPNRILLEQSLVVPGQVGRFAFEVVANVPAGTHREYFRPVVDGLRPMDDLGLFLDFTVRCTNSC